MVLPKQKVVVCGRLQMWPKQGLHSEFAHDPHSNIIGAFSRDVPLIGPTQSVMPFWPREKRLAVETLAAQKTRERRSATFVDRQSSRAASPAWAAVNCATSASRIP